MKESIRCLVLFFLMIFLFGCENSRNYSQLLKQEEMLIDDWLVRENIELLEEFPSDTVFSSNQMYHFEEGIYFQLLKKGDGDSLRPGDKILLRYIQSTLDEHPIIESYWTTQDRPYPPDIFFGDLKNSCEGWQRAFELMKRSGSEARIIVPSKLGRNNSEVIPYVYKMKFKIVQK